MRKIISALALFVLVGCRQNIDLEAIRSLAATTAAASDAYTAISLDFYSSCVRAYEWDRAGSLKPAALPKLADACSLNQTASQQWENANLVVLQYVRALGDLAGGSDTGNDFGIPALASSISGATKSSLDPSQVTSMANLATSLVTDIYNIRRRNAIATVAPKADSDLQQLIGVLEKIAQNNYSNQLDFETDAIEDFYRPVVANPPGTTGRVPHTVHPASANTYPPLVLETLRDVDRVQRLRLRKEYRVDRAAVDDRRKAIDAYVSSLETIKSAHSAILTAIQSGGIEAASGIIQGYVSQLGPQIATLRKATGGGSSQ